MSSYLIDTILLVDDDSIANFVHSSTLKEIKASKNVIFCENGRQAIDMIHHAIDHNRLTELPQLIFLDINMPEMNGFDFLREFEKIQSKLKPIRIFVMLTTRLNEQDKMRINRCQHIVDEIVEKPLDKDKLLELLNKHFVKN